MNLPFQYVQLLWLLLLLPLITGIFLYAKQRKKKTFQKIGDPALVQELIGDYKPASFVRKFLLILFAMLLILLGVANLRSKTGTEKIDRNGIDVMIALDVSKSMLAQDIKPTRLDRAKQFLGRLIDKLGNDRIGLVVFAGKAYLQMPLTGDHSAAQMYLAAATTETVPTQGTVIGDALKMSYASFNAKEKKYKAVVLVSDGEDHDDNAIKIAEQMAEEGVVIYTVGIGSPEGAPIMDEETNEFKKDKDGNTVITKLNEDELREIAAKGNGAYQLYGSTDAVASSLSAQLATLDTRAVEDDSLIDYKSWCLYLLGGALLLLILELFVSEVKKRSTVKLKTAATFVLLCFCFSSQAQQSDKESINHGNEAYKKNDYQTAVKDYSKATATNDKDAVAQFNLGNALYKGNKKDDAAGAYDKAEDAMTAPLQKSAALYNKGVVLQGDNKTDDCIAAYENALKLDPDNADARHNLEIALQQKQQKDKKNGGGNNQNNNNQKKPDNKNNKNQQPQTGMSQKDAAQKLQALADQEGQLQDKLHKVNAAAPDKPEKDW